MKVTVEKLWERLMGFSLGLLIIGGLAWGIVGLLDINIVQQATQLIPVIGNSTAQLVERLIYFLIGLAGLGRAAEWFSELPEDL